jgi:hypothetical protein
MLHLRIAFYASLGFFCRELKKESIIKDIKLNQFFNNFIFKNGVFYVIHYLYIIRIN